MIIIEIKSIVIVFIENDFISCGDSCRFIFLYNILMLYVVYVYVSIYVLA